MMAEICPQKQEIPAVKRLTFERVDGGMIKIAREIAGLNRSELAERAGVTYNTIFNLETGRNVARSDTFVAVCQALEPLGFTFVQGANNQVQMKLFGKFIGGL